MCFLMSLLVGAAAEWDAEDEWEDNLLDVLLEVLFEEMDRLETEDVFVVAWKKIGRAEATPKGGPLKVGRKLTTCTEAACAVTTSPWRVIEWKGVVTVTVSAPVVVTVTVTVLEPSGMLDPHSSMKVTLLLWPHMPFWKVRAHVCVTMMEPGVQVEIPLVLVEVEVEEGKENWDVTVTVMTIVASVLGSVKVVVGEEMESVTRTVVESTWVTMIGGNPVWVDVEVEVEVEMDTVAVGVTVSVMITWPRTTTMDRRSANRATLVRSGYFIPVGFNDKSPRMDETNESPRRDGL
jgi:hypothetical protein